MLPLRKYRLPIAGPFPLRLPSAPIGHLDSVGLFSDGLVWIEGWLSRAGLPSVEIALIAGKNSLTVRAESFEYSRPDVSQTPDVAGRLLVAEVEGVLTGESHLDEVRIRQRKNGTWYRLSPRAGVQLATPDQSLQQPLTEGLTEEDRDRLRVLVDKHIRKATAPSKSLHALAAHLLPAARGTVLDFEWLGPGLFWTTISQAEFEPSLLELRLVSGVDTHDTRVTSFPLAGEGQGATGAGDVASHLLVAEVDPLRTSSSSAQLLLVRQSADAPWGRLDVGVHASSGMDCNRLSREVAEKLAGPDRERLRMLLEAHIQHRSQVPSNNLRTLIEQLSLPAPEPPPRDPPAPLGVPFVTSLLDPLAGWIDPCVVVDEEHLFISGWLWDEGHRVSALEIVVNGVPTSTLDQLSRSHKPTVTERLRELYGQEADRRHAFFGLVPLQGRSLLGAELRTLHFELHLRDGARWGLNLPPVIRDPFAGRDAMMASVPEERFLDRELLTRHFLPALDAFARRCREAASSHIADQIDFGPHGSCGSSPAASLLVPVGGNFDLLAPQLALFGQDRELREAQLILVLDAPEEPELTKRQVFDLAHLYSFSGKAIFAEPRVGYASAINLAAAAADGRRLVLMHSDTFPERPGWLGSLLAHLDAHPDCGIVGPKLLSDAATIWSCGIELRRDLEFDGLLTPRHRGRGLPRHAGVCSQPALVPALSSACLVLDRELFAELGGLTDGYVAGDFDDLDLCLGSHRSGRRVRYTPEVELLHLGRHSRLTNVAWNRNAWTDVLNRLRLGHRWPDEPSSTASPT